MFLRLPKRIYDWEDQMLAPGTDAHSFPLPGTEALEVPRFVGAAREAQPLFALPELPALVVPEFLARPRPSAPHPHRRRLRWARARRPGSIPRPSQHCLSPVRRSRGARARFQ